MASLNDMEADQIQIDMLDEEVDRMDPASENYVRLLRDLSKLCGSLGRFPTSCVLHDEVNLCGEFAHSCGGFSDVWKAQYRETLVAVKAPRIHMADQLAMRKVFCHEIIYWRRLNHPHIVRFLGICSKFYLSIVSEWMPNGDLPTYVGAHPEIARLPLIVQVASALEYMHAYHVVHGDIKGRNILVNSHGHACISDFGLAITVYRTQSLGATHTSTGNSQGTVRWSAPERLAATDDPRYTMPTVASDVYSFAMMMWEVYTLHVPFHTDRQDVRVLLMIVDGKRPEQVPEIPDRLWPLMQKCWMHEPRDRVSSAAISMQLRKELDRKQVVWSDFIQAAVNAAEEFSNACPLIKQSVSDLLAALKAFEEVDGVPEDLSYTAQRLTIMKSAYAKHNSELDASERAKTFLEAVVRTIQMVAKAVTIKSGRGILKDILKYSADMKAIWNNLRMIGDIAHYFVTNITTSRHYMPAYQILNKLTFVESAHFLSVNTGRPCTEGTRIELLTDLLAWGTATSDVPKVCLVTGCAGAGKSTIAHTVCGFLQGLDLLGGTFFCSRYDDDRRRSTQSIFSTLARSLARIDSDYAFALAQALTGPAEAGSFVAKRQLRDLICTPMRDAHSGQQAPIAPVRVLVIDALDECVDDEKTLYDLMFTLLAECNQLPVKFIITSRSGSAINRAFEEAESGSFVCYHVDDIPEDISRSDLMTYIRSELNEYAQACEVPEGWPPVSEVEALANQAGTLFLYASTACKYIQRSGHDAAHRLKELNTVGVHQSQGIAPIYGFVSRQFKNGASWEIARRCLHFIVHLRQPLSLGELADFTGIDCQQLRTALTALQPVINIPPANHARAISVLHASFPDYLVNEGRLHCSDWFITSTAVHTYMLLRCLRVMKVGLRFNVSNCVTSYATNSEQLCCHNISGALHYSCLHWIDHLEDCGDFQISVMDSLSELLHECFLYWLEVLSATSSIRAASLVMTRLMFCMAKHEVDTLVRGEFGCSTSRSTANDLQQFAADAKAFTIAFAVPIESSCPHIYLSALAATSKQSKVWSRVLKTFNNVPRIIEPQSRAKQSNGWSKLFRPFNNVPRPITLQSRATCSVFILRGHENNIWSVDFSADGTHIVSGSWDKSIRLWNAATGAAVGEPMRGHEDRIYSVAFSPDSTRIVSGSDDKTIRLWDAATGETVGEPLRGHESRVYCVAFSPDGRRVVSGSLDKTIRLWDVATRNAIGEPFRGHKKEVESVAFSPDGLRIASGSWDQTICLWDAATGKLIGEPLLGHENIVLSVAFSPDGNRIVSGSSDKTIRLWDALTGKAVGKPLLGHTGSTQSIRFSPDGMRIVSSSKDQTICLWNASTGAAIGEPMRGHTGAIYSVAFSRDGTRIVSSSSDQTIRVWDVAVGEYHGEHRRRHSIESLAFLQEGAQTVATSWEDRLSASQVAFSHDAAHSTCIDNLLPPGLDPRDIFTLGEDGWLRGPNGELFLWILPEYRKGLWWPRTTEILDAQPVMLDLSRFAHGVHWIRCVSGDEEEES